MVEKRKAIVSGSTPDACAKNWCKSVGGEFSYSKRSEKSVDDAGEYDWGFNFMCDGVYVQSAGFKWGKGYIMTWVE